MNKPQYSAPALDKGLDIIECLAAAVGPMTQADLVRTLARSQSEIYRMLDCLLRRGYITRDSGGAYALTLKLFALAHRHDPVDRLRRAAVAPMERFAEATGQSCHLSLLHGASVLVLVERLPGQTICLAVGEGSIAPLSHSASGQLLLALQTPERRADLLATDPSYRSQSRKDRATLAAALKQVATSGCLCVPSESSPGATDLVVPVGVPQTELQGALAIPVLPRLKVDARRDERLLGLARTCAADINDQLGIGS